MTSVRISLLLLLSTSVYADQLVHSFNNPSFSGVGTSSHWLTIENQEHNREADIQAELKAYQEDLAREADNTTLARFIRNVESRVYAQLSRQLVDNLFGENPSESGSIELLGSVINFTSDGELVTLDITDEDGNQTVITVPIGSFTF